MSSSSRAAVLWQADQDFSQILIDAFPTFIVTIGGDGRVLLMNRAMLDALGYEREQVLGQDYLAHFVPTEDRPALIQLLERTRSSREPNVHVNRVLTCQGQEVLVEWHGRPFFHHDGELHFFFAVGIDISGRSKIEEQRAELAAEQAARAQAETARERIAVVLAMLKRSEERYRAFVEHSSEGIWCFEAATPLPIDVPEDRQIEVMLERARLVECNDVMGRMYGFADARQILGTPLRQMLVASAQNLEMLRAFIRSGYRLIDAESREPDRDGNIKYYLNNLVGIIENGKLVRAWGTQRDITERKRAEEAFRRNERLVTMGRMAATIAHEINNPLESVTNLLYLLTENLWLDESARQYVTQAQEEVHRISQIVGRTLGLQRETADAVPVKISELFDGVLDLYRHRIEMRRVSVVRRYDSEEAVIGFPGQLRQVFSNLLLNGLDAAGQGGVVVLRIRRSRQPGLSSRAGVRVSVADNGPGIRGEDRAKLYEPFFTTKGERGNGLGLWISRGILDAHHGSLRFRTSTVPGRSGTVFSVFLPSASAEVANAQGA
jgi:PAS domain S-box-containing protein